MVCRDRVCAIPRSGRVTEDLKRTVKRIWVKGLWKVWRNIRYDNHTIDCTPLYLRKLWAVKCNEQAERQLSKAKPPYRKLSIVCGDFGSVSRRSVTDQRHSWKSVVLEHGYRRNGLRLRCSALIQQMERIVGWNGVRVAMLSDLYHNKRQSTFFTEINFGTH